MSWGTCVFVTRDGEGAAWCAASLRTDVLEVMNGYESSAVLLAFSLWKHKKGSLSVRSLLSPVFVIAQCIQGLISHHH